MAHDNSERPNPPRRGLRKGLYLIPSFFTAANIGMGFYSVMASLRGFQLLGSATPDLAGAAAQFDSAANIGMGFYSVMASLRGFQLLGSENHAATPSLSRNP